MNTHEHRLNPRIQVCEDCHMTAEAIVGGRDKSATWKDVDAAYRNGLKQGIEFTKANFRRTRRRKLIEVGAYLQLRIMRSQLVKPRDYIN